MIEIIDSAAISVEQRYRGFLLQLVGLFGQIMDGPAPSSQQARDVYTLRSSIQHGLSLTMIAQVVDEALGALVDGALTGAGLDAKDPISENLTSIVKEGRNALIAQFDLISRKDMEVPATHLREFSMQVERVLSARRTTLSGAVFEVKTQMSPHFKFNQIDRGNRQWPSTLYAKTATRGFLVKSYIDSYVTALSKRGVDMAIVKHPEEGHKHAGLAFSISGVIPNIPAYRDIRDEVWHPNSRALVSHA
jgi:hypothetical protein